MSGRLRRAAWLFIVLALTVAGCALGRICGIRLRSGSYSRLATWPSAQELDAADSAPVPPDAVFASVLDKIRHDYVGTPGDVSTTRLTDGALSRMLSSFNDPHTRYLDANQWATVQSGILGRRAGIGAEFCVTTTRRKDEDVDYRYLTVQSVAAGSPAAKAGITAGDRITELNGRWIIAYPVTNDAPGSISTSGAARPDSGPLAGIRPGLSAARAIDTLSSGSGQQLQLKLSRSGAERTVQLTTCETVTEPVTFRSTSRGVLYLRVNQFNASAMSAIDKALNQRSDWSRGLILDLRQNPGGVMAGSTTGLDGYQAALDMLGRLCRRPRIGQVEQRAGTKSDLLITSGIPTPNRQSRLLVLIDGGTCNLAELTAAAMRDSGGATLIGEKTRGDNVLARLTPVAGGGGVEVTAARLYTASGADIGAGIQPDRIARSQPGSDTALTEALRMVGS